MKRWNASVSRKRARNGLDCDGDDLMNFSSKIASAVLSRVLLLVPVPLLATLDSDDAELLLLLLSAAPVVVLDLHVRGVGARNAQQRIARIRRAAPSTLPTGNVIITRTA